MNAHTQTFELSVEGRQADEVVASLFHTVLFHRSTGKFFYTSEDNYSVGTVGYRDVDCDYIDLTYVCCSSNRLITHVQNEISKFSDRLRQMVSTPEKRVGGAISLEFFHKRAPRLFFQQEMCMPWEVWTVNLELITANSHMDGEHRCVCREQLGELLADKIMYIADVMNRHDNYLPKMPNQSEIDLIFDTSYEDVQPYLFKVHHSVASGAVTRAGEVLGGTGTNGAIGSLSPSTTSTMKKLIKGTLTLRG